MALPLVLRQCLFGALANGAYKKPGWHEMSGAVHVGNQTDYFERIGYQPTWFIGDRVRGKWHKIPFCGTVGNDTQISETEGPRVSVFLDLPIKHNNQIYTVIFVKPQEIKELK